MKKFDILKYSMLIQIFYWYLQKQTKFYFLNLTNKINLETVIIYTNFR